ncbi:hypothetical protein EDC94DRAFT_646460 [Helicostylum pulchrum]|nr:hypothetical protein EDC94DRAFT_646460 [Helicostylum pulchrum]
MTKRNPSKALELFKVIASVWKNPIAEYLIGAIYCEGDRGVPKDEKTGIKWFILAEKNGWSDVMTSAAIHCFPAASEGGKLKMALAWLENVANDDDTDAALIDNSTLYLFGNKNFELSMAHIEPEVQRILHSKEEYNIVSSIKHLQRECDPRIISNYKKFHGISTAQFFLSRVPSKERLYADVEKTLYWVKKLQKNYGEDGYVWLGLFYTDGKDIEPDYKEAAKWFASAYIYGRSPSASFHLAYLHCVGEDVERNCSIALKLFEEYLRNNDYDYGGLTCLATSEIYRDGNDGVPQDYQKAQKYFSEANELGNIRGRDELWATLCC